MTRLSQFAAAASLVLISINTTPIWLLAENPDDVESTALSKSDRVTETKQPTYHQKTLDLLGITAIESADAKRQLHKREAALGRKLPESVRQWYCLPQANEILDKYSNMDDSVPIPELGKVEPGAPDDLARGLLLIQNENQGVAAWYVKLDGTPDPPVMVESELVDEAIPQQESATFSEWVYRRVLIYAGNKEARPFVEKFQKAGALPWMDSLGHIREVNLHQDSASDESLQLACKIPTLMRLTVWDGGKIASATWKELVELKSLIALDITSPSFGDEAVECLLGLPDLEDLDLGTTAVSDKGVERLLTEKQWLQLRFDGEQYSDEALKHLEHQVRLDALWLSSTRISSQGLAAIGESKRLTLLDITHTPLQDGDLRAALSKLEHLETLDLQETGVSDEFLPGLADCKELKRLNLNSTKVRGPGLASLEGLALEQLSLMDTPLEDVGLDHIAKITTLQQLYVSSTPITDAGVRKLVTLRELGSLGVQCKAVTYETAEWLRKQLPKLYSMDGPKKIDRRMRLPPGVLDALQDLKSLLHRGAPP